ncbi:SMP-30/gluconolactonase/LRE family protein [Hoeflea sp. WL0058]|uniref:SMP-30/gluconolactonase/LRE family protein n=1 Tax=Flavimaribacter sediminis TaxID=2865987 RepID=A0AAE2ZQ42_9HYPH|nr:SMP-30/gluconolactonase/LRE family protein [Flavimaribacter sediminis]MBW8640698.1 SMP-30/gluconolactonase/LRE family protein [Flavimaribacter sediminis]
MTIRFERIGPGRDWLGESPVWDPSTASMFWVDSRSGIVRRFQPSSGRQRSWQLPAEIGAIALAGQGRLIAALRNGFYYVDLESGEIERIVEAFDDDDSARFNDGKMDRQGRFLCGTMALGSDEPTGKLVQLNGGGQVKILETGIGIANSTCFSPDGRVLYFADSFDRALRAYDYDPDTGSVSNRRILCDVSTHNSATDGATVDSEGGIWVCLVQIGKLARLTPDGALDRLIDTPVPLPSCPAFGGEDMNVLYLTSIRDSGTGRTKSDDPKAGALFAIHGLGVRGIAEAAYSA